MLWPVCDPMTSSELVYLHTRLLYAGRSQKAPTRQAPLVVIYPVPGNRSMEIVSVCQLIVNSQWLRMSRPMMAIQ